jgi:hypothetical protein
VGRHANNARDLLARDDSACYRASTILSNRFTRSWYLVGILSRRYCGTELTLAGCLVGHFTVASVEAFIGKHAIQWGTHNIPVRMSWGCRKLLSVNVVAFSLLGDSSELAYNHQAISNGQGSVELVRNKCAPIGINMADLDDMRKEFRYHVEDVAENYLPHYVEIAHDDQSSKLAERLLEAVCHWYQKGVGDNDEVSRLRTPDLHISHNC